jgi:hypothetical protein
MRRARFVGVVASVVVALVCTACSGARISASTCDEVVDETMELLQRLIDDVDQQAGDTTLEDYVASGEELPSIDEFKADAAKIDEIAADLQCSQPEITAAVDARVDELSATTELGRFVVNAIRSGGL